jgi:hypothetical protein
VASSRDRLFAVLPAAITFITLKCLKSKANPHQIDDGEGLAMRSGATVVAGRLPVWFGSVPGV